LRFTITIKLYLNFREKEIPYLHWQHNQIEIKNKKWYR
jgi:hypothetical protein